MANKKNFDREKMYRKIMPTYYDNNDALAQDSTHIITDYDPMESEVPDEPVENDFSNFEAENVVSFPSQPLNEPRMPVDAYQQAVNSALLKTSEIERIRDQHNNVAIYNLTEKVIMEKLDIVMDNMNCCKCDRCKMDVIALTLNNMQPYYVVRSKNGQEYGKLEEEIAEQATKEVLKSTLKVRKNPRH